MTVMTPGEILLLQQIQLVAHARGWSLKKTISKLTKILETLQQVKAKETPKQAAAPSKAEAELIEQAEAILKSLQSKPEPPPAPPSV